MMLDIGRSNISTIGIVGLGLIGGSLAKAVSVYTACKVLAYDSDEQTNKSALECSAIDDILSDQNIAECDIIMVSLYPSGVIDYVLANLDKMKKGCIVIDVAGVKRRICDQIAAEARKYGIYFIGGHPMAGIEKSGFANSFSDLFDNAIMLLTPARDISDDMLNTLNGFFLEIGFGKVKITDADKHDRIIAYTSQLAHIVSNAYVKSDTIYEKRGFSAGSFRDLTRVARLHAGMWSELFFENKDYLLDELDTIIENLQKYRQALNDDDRTTMLNLLKDGNDIVLKYGK